MEEMLAHLQLCRVHLMIPVVPSCRLQEHLAHPHAAPAPGIRIGDQVIQEDGPLAYAAGEAWPCSCGQTAAVRIESTIIKAMSMADTTSIQFSRCISEVTLTTAARLLTLLVDICNTHIEAPHATSV